MFKMTFNNENNSDAYSKVFSSRDTTPIIKTGAPESSSSPFYSGVVLARTSVFYVVFFRSLVVLLSFIVKSLCCMFFFDLRILITLLVSSNSFLSLFVHCVVCPSLIYGFWLPVCYLPPIMNAYAGVSHTLSSLLNKFVPNTSRQDRLEMMCQMH